MPAPELGQALFEQRANRAMQPFITQKDGSHATHKMAAEVDDQGNWFAFPTVQQMPNGLLVEMALRDAQARAMRTGEFKSFGKNKDAALLYAEGGYKRGTPMDDTRNQMYMLEQLLKGRF